MPQGDHLILVIDDEQPIRRFLRAALTAEGYRVVEAGTGEGNPAAPPSNRPTS